MLSIKNTLACLVMQFVCALFLITGLKTAVFIFAVMTSDALADRGRSPPADEENKENTQPEQRASTPTQDEGSSLGSLPCSVGAH